MTSQYSVRDDNCLYSFRIKARYTEVQNKLNPSLFAFRALFYENHTLQQNSRKYRYKAQTSH